MKFIKKVDIKNGNFTATFFNGKTTNDRTVANFFMIMQDKDCTKSEAEEYIKIGRMTDFMKPWDEIESVIKCSNS